MSVLSFISSVFKPVTDLVDELHYSGEEKGNIENKRAELKNELAKIQSDVMTKMLSLEEKVLESSSKVAIAETKSDSWFTRVYRPAIVSGMFILICCNYIGILPVQLPDIFVTIFGSTFGVVSVGRSVEKIKNLGK